MSPTSQAMVAREVKPWRRAKSSRRAPRNCNQSFRAYVPPKHCCRWISRLLSKNVCTSRRQSSVMEFDEELCCVLSPRLQGHLLSATEQHARSADATCPCLRKRGPIVKHTGLREEARMCAMTCDVVSNVGGRQWFAATTRLPMPTTYAKVVINFDPSCVSKSFTLSTMMTSAFLAAWVDVLSTV